MYLSSKDIRGLGKVGLLAGGLGSRSLGEVDWAAVKAAKYYDPATGTEKPITDVEINKWTSGTNISRTFAENQMTTPMVIQNVRGFMLGGKQAVVDPNLISMTEKGWWGNFWGDFQRRTLEPLGKLKWPALGVGAVVAGVALYSLYRRIAGPGR